MLLYLLYMEDVHGVFEDFHNHLLGVYTTFRMAINGMREAGKLESERMTDEYEYSIMYWRIEVIYADKTTPDNAIAAKIYYGDQTRVTAKREEERKQRELEYQQERNEYWKSLRSN